MSTHSVPFTAVPATGLAGPGCFNPPPSSFRAELARSAAALEAAQRLRYTVFAEEMGATLHTSVPGLDQDRFDPYCRHLIVRDALGQVIGCTRILTANAAQRAGGFYSQTEFELGPVLALPGRLAEIGRTCIHPDHRSGAAISTLWSGLAGLIATWGIDYLIGCASIPLGTESGAAWALYADLAPRYLLPESLRVIPHLPLPRHDGLIPQRPALPPLLKAYLRLGARLGGPPCLDPHFKAADVFILLATAQIERRYARHFLDSEH